jgi:hypothetical protein
MNVANHFITNFHYPRHITCSFPHLQKNYDKYPRLEVGEVPQTILRLSMKVFTMRKCLFKLPHELAISLRGRCVDFNGRFLSLT